MYSWICYWTIERKLKPAFYNVAFMNFSLWSILWTMVLNITQLFHTSSLYKKVLVVFLFVFLKAWFKKKSLVSNCGIDLWLHVDVGLCFYSKQTFPSEQNLKTSSPENLDWRHHVEVVFPCFISYSTLYLLWSRCTLLATSDHKGRVTYFGKLWAWIHCAVEMLPKCVMKNETLSTHILQRFLLWFY